MEIIRSRLDLQYLKSRLPNWFQFPTLSPPSRVIFNDKNGGKFSTYFSFENESVL